MDRTPNYTNNLTFICTFHSSYRTYLGQESESRIYDINAEYTERDSVSISVLFLFFKETLSFPVQSFFFSSPVFSSPLASSGSGESDSCI